MKLFADVEFKCPKSLCVDCLPLASLAGAVANYLLNAASKSCAVSSSISKVHSVFRVGTTASSFLFGQRQAKSSVRCNRKGLC